MWVFFVYQAEMHPALGITFRSAFLRCGSVHACTSLVLRFVNMKVASYAVVFGEDVAFGGVFRCAVGLREKFGKCWYTK